MRILRDPRIRRLRQVARVNRLLSLVRRQLDENHHVLEAMEKHGCNVGTRWAEQFRLDQTYVSLLEERDTLLKAIDGELTEPSRVH